MVPLVVIETLGAGEDDAVARAVSLLKAELASVDAEVPIAVDRQPGGVTEDHPVALVRAVRAEPGLDGEIALENEGGIAAAINEIVLAIESQGLAAWRVDRNGSMDLRIEPVARGIGGDGARDFVEGVVGD